MSRRGRGLARQLAWGWVPYWSPAGSVQSPLWADDRLALRQPLADRTTHAVTVDLHAGSVVVSERGATREGFFPGARPAITSYPSVVHRSRSKQPAEGQKVKNWRDYFDSGLVGKMFTGDDTSELIS
jgi:hypothetical protein